jgi:hypothetical protein
MKSTKLMALVLTGGFIAFWLFPASVMAASPIVSWEDIIGIIQAGNLVGMGTGQVRGAGQPWSTQEGFARVNLETGMVQFLVRGLVLAGGNSIGTPDAVTQVKGTLVCNTSGSAGGGNSVLVDTDLVPLDDQGDAHFVGDVGILPPACVTEPDIAFLIRTSGGAWLANGSVRKLGHHHWPPSKDSQQR